MLEPQRYPEVRPAEGREILRPYDVATWTLPLMMGVAVERAELSEAKRASMTRVAAPILSEKAPAGTAGAGAPAPGPLAIEPGGPEVSRVLTAALRRGGKVRLVPRDGQRGRSHLAGRHRVARRGGGAAGARHPGRDRRQDAVAAARASRAR